MRGRASFGVAAGFLAIAALATLLASASAGAGTNRSVGATASSKKLCVSIYSNLQRRWRFDVRAMQQEAKTFGYGITVQYANNDPALQSTQVESMVTKGCAALIMVPVDITGAASIVSYARGQNVPVVAYDSMINSTKVNFIVQRDNVGAGEMQAKAAVNALNGKGVIAIIKGDASTGVAQQMSQGYDSVLKSQSGLKVVYNQFTKNWDPTTAETNAENVLSANANNIQGIVSMNDGMAAGIIQALKGANLAGKVFLSGMDADPPNLQYIAQGYQTMSVWTPIDVEGKTAAKVAVMLAKGQKPKPETYVTYKGVKIPEDPVHVIALTKSNLCAFITKIAPQGWIKVTDVFPDNPNQCG